MTPFKTTSKDTAARCHFIHANGFHPNSYSSMLKHISKNHEINTLYLRQFWDSYNCIGNIKNWDIFLDDITRQFIECKVINEFAIGHSIGGNLLLRAAINNRKLFKSIVLLDPTIFSPKIICLWSFIKIFESLPILNRSTAFQLINSAKSRRTTFKNYESTFNAYRKKKIFQRIRDKQLMDYIKSIFILEGDSIRLRYDIKWEIEMYRSAGKKDFNIWYNLQKLRTPTLIITPEISPVFRSDAKEKIQNNKFIKLETLDNSTHLFPLEYPSKTSSLIADFFQKQV